MATQTKDHPEALHFWPGHEEVAKEIKALKAATPGKDALAGITALDKVVSEALNESLNVGIGAYYHYAYTFDALSAFFARTSVALPGVSHFFKILAVAERSDAVLLGDFIHKRGGVVSFGPIAAPPDDFHSDEVSDVLYAFIKTLAFAKTAYAYTNKSLESALKAADAHAIDFLGQSARALSEKIRVGAAHVLHLKVIGSDKFAIKAFDRELTALTADLAIATQLEATLPPRLQLGVYNRLLLTQAADAGKGRFDEVDRARSVVQRAQI